MNALIASMSRVDERYGSVRAEDTFDTDIEDLWSAITEPERVARWLAEIDGDLRQGGAIHARFVSSWEGEGRIERCERPHRLHLMMVEDGNKTELEAWLTADGARTRLVVEERGLPLDGLHFYGAGWQAHLEDLGHYLAGDATGWKRRWDELVPTYRTASVI